MTQRHNRDHEVDIRQLIDNVYKPPDRVFPVSSAVASGSLLFLISQCTPKPFLIISIPIVMANAPYSNGKVNNM